MKMITSIYISRSDRTGPLKNQVKSSKTKRVPKKMNASRGSERGTWTSVSSGSSQSTWTSLYRAVTSNTFIFQVLIKNEFFDILICLRPDFLSRTLLSVQQKKIKFGENVWFSSGLIIFNQISTTELAKVAGYPRVQPAAKI